MAYQLELCSKFKRITHTPQRIERKRRVFDPFWRLKNRRRPIASLLGARAGKIAEIRQKRDGPSRVGKPSDPFRQFAERQAMHAVYEAHRRKIRAMSDLLEGQDKNSAKPPRKAAVNLALQFVDLLEKRRLRIAWSTPTIDDSIMVVLDTGMVRQEWEFYGDGDTAVMIQKTGEEKRYLDLDASEFTSHLPR